ncbi:unnamed protein product [Orchesella dallaii]|uniref:Odorant receptor n=1 Tax=Orchesella dallaii TaxID=48710 RepID=A0ABP1RAP8_9HEXA
MLLKNQFIPAIQQALLIDSWFHIMPFKLNESTRNFDIENSRSSKYWRLAGTLYFNITGAIMLFSVLGRSFSDDLVRSSQTLAIGLLHILGGTICRTLHTKHVDIVAVLNELLKIEQEMEQDGVTSSHDSRTIIIKWILNVIVISGKCYSFLGAIGAGYDPKFPTNSFAIYTPDLESLGSIYWNVLFRVLTALINLVVWHILGSLGAIITIEMIVIRLLVQLLNHVHANGFVVHLFIFLSVGQISAMYCLIRCGGLPIPILITLIFIGVDSYVVVIGVYGCAGEVNKTSKQVTEHVKRESDKARHLLVQKTTGGFPDLRVGFGNLNFIERLAGFFYFYITGAFTLLSLLGKNFSDDLINSSQTLAIGLLLILGGTTFWTVHTKHAGVVTVLNELLKIEQKMEQNGVVAALDSRSIIIKWIVKVIVMSGKCYPVVGALGTGFDPKFPTN